MTKIQSLRMKQSRPRLIANFNLQEWNSLDQGSGQKFNLQEWINLDQGSGKKSNL